MPHGYNYYLQRRDPNLNPPPPASLFKFKTIPVTTITTMVIGNVFPIKLLGDYKNGLFSPMVNQLIIYEI